MSSSGRIVTSVSKTEISRVYSFPGTTFPKVEYLYIQFEPSEFTVFSEFVKIPPKDFKQ